MIDSPEVLEAEAAPIDAAAEGLAAADFSASLPGLEQWPQDNLSGADDKARARLAALQALLEDNGVSPADRLRAAARPIAGG